MSLRTLLIWCIIAGLLGGAAVVLRDRGVQAAEDQQPEWVGLQFDPAAVTRIELGDAGASVRIERNLETVDQWLGLWSHDTGEMAWGVSASRVRGALRALATARVRLSDERLIQDTYDEIVIAGRDEAKTTLQIGTDRSGGRAPVRVEQMDTTGAIERVLDGWLDSSIADALTYGVTLTWRDEKLLQLAPTSVESIRISAFPYTTTLERNGGRWSITNPVRVHADREKCEQLVRSALAIKVAGFVEQVIDDATSGMDNPLAVIEVRSGDKDYTLSIGKGADIGGDLLYGQFASGDTETLIRVSKDAFTKLTAVPDAYVSGIAVPTGATDIRSLTVLSRDGASRLQVRRNAGEWSIGEERTDSLTGESIERLIRLLTQSQADAVRLLDAETEVPKLIAGIELTNLQGSGLGSYGIALQPSESGIRLLVMQTLADGQRVVWSYVGDEAQATGTWLTVAATRVGSQG